MTSSSDGPDVGDLVTVDRTLWNDLKGRLSQPWVVDGDELYAVVTLAKPHRMLQSETMLHLTLLNGTYESVRFNVVNKRWVTTVLRRMHLLLGTLSETSGCDVPTWKD